MPSKSEQLSVFPAFFRVEGKIAAVFGNGDEAFAKVRLLLEYAGEGRCLCRSP